MFKMSRKGLKEKGRSCVKDIGILIFALIGIILIFFVLPKYVKDWLKIYDKIAIIDLENSASKSDWITFISTWWGAVVAAIISGFVSIIGIVLSINYYRKSDINNMIVENQPFLQLILESHSIQEKIYLQFKICNLGRGFAFLIGYNDFSTVGGYVLDELIQADSSITIMMPLNKEKFSKEKKITLTYLDRFGNEFMQTYEFKGDISSLRVSCNYPVLTGKYVE